MPETEKITITLRKKTKKALKNYCGTLISKSAFIDELVSKKLKVKSK